jgi:hypothetical protein
MVVCPEDRARLLWQTSPTRFSPVPGYPGATYSNGTPDGAFRWPFSSSYQLVPAAFSEDRNIGTSSTTGPTASYRLFVNTLLPLGKRRFFDVSLPSSKVLMFDEIARHGKAPAYYAYPDTFQPLLFCDTSVRDIRTRDTNQGEDPNAVSTGPGYVPSSALYIGDPAFQPAARGDPTLGDVVETRYQWTRHGLHGADTR